MKNSKQTKSSDSCDAPCSAVAVGDWVRDLSNPRRQGLVTEEQGQVELVDFGHSERWINKEHLQVCDIGDFDTDRDKPWLRKFLSEIKPNANGLGRRTLDADSK